MAGRQGGPGGTPRPLSDPAKSDPTGFPVTGGLGRVILARGPASIIDTTAAFIVVGGPVVHISEASP